MGFGSHYVTSTRCCFSFDEYNEWMNEHNHKSDDDSDDKIFSKWFYLTYCDESEKYREFVDDVCSHHRPHRTIITFNYCQNDFKAFNTKEVRCSACCRSMERKLKTYTFERIEKIADVYNTKGRRQDNILDELVQI